MKKPCGGGTCFSSARSGAAYDLAVRRLLADADIIDGKTGRAQCLPALYLAAFRAQEQFRKTVKTIKDLEDSAERKAARVARRKRSKNGSKNNGQRPQLRKKPNPRVKRTDNPVLPSPLIPLPEGRGKRAQRQGEGDV